MYFTQLRPFGNNALRRIGAASLAGSKTGAEVEPGTEDSGKPQDARFFSSSSTEKTRADVTVTPKRLRGSSSKESEYSPPANSFARNSVSSGWKASRVAEVLGASIRSLTKISMSRPLKRNFESRRGSDSKRLQAFSAAIVACFSRS